MPRFPDRPEPPTPATWTITTRRKSTPTRFHCRAYHSQRAWTARTIPDHGRRLDDRAFEAIKCYDQLKVNAVVNWIKGKTHLGGSSSAPVPAIFGMNFQAVSVGQKLIENGTFGGYTDAAGDPTPSMLGEIEFVDGGDRPDGRRTWRTSTCSIRRPSSSLPSTANRRSTPTASSPFRDLRGRTARRRPRSSAALLTRGAKPRAWDPTEDDISQLWLNNPSDTPDRGRPAREQRESGGNRPDLLWRLAYNHV